MVANLNSFVFPFDHGRTIILTDQYVYIDDIASFIQEIPPDSIISRTYYDGEKLKAILFGFAPGQELSEHTAAKPAILHFLEGESRLSLGDDEKVVGPGAWVYMEPHLSHSIVARNRVVMLLLLLN
jgi:quercetin dioxygenase-like cupin family protein